MLIFRKGHSHIKQDDLSAYLDGQISEADAARIDQRLAQCADCRQELDALRSTVSLLQQMPELTLPRSFIMPGPPPAPIAIRPPAPLRMPQWVYSGSAAVAALVLAVLISADATGLLAQDIPARTLESTSAAATAPQAAPERLQADGAEAAVEMAAPLAPVAELAVKAEKGISVTVTQESEISEAAAKAPAPPGAPGAAAAPQAAARLEAQDDSEAAAPVAAMAEAQVADAAKAESAAPPQVADLTYAEAEVVAETTATPPPAVSALTTPDKPSGPALVAQERSGGIPPAQNPFTLWRILEGVTAITALTFLVMWLLRRRTKR